MLPRDVAEGAIEAPVNDKTSAPRTPARRSKEKADHSTFQGTLVQGI
jgi:hypothetical protein